MLSKAKMAVRDQKNKQRRADAINQRICLLGGKDISGGYGKYGGSVLSELPLECRNGVHLNYIGRQVVP